MYGTARRRKKKCTDAKVGARDRVPMHGQELLNFVADLVLKGYTPITIARKAAIPIFQASRLKAEIFERIYSKAAETYTPEGLKRLKHELSETLRQIIDDCKDAVDESREADDGINTRPYGQALTATKLLSAMHGFNAPIKVENTDLRLYAAVRPDQMDRVMTDPVARKAMLDFEEAVHGLNLSADAAREPYVRSPVLPLGLTIDIEGDEVYDPAEEIDDTANPWDGINADDAEGDQ